MRKAALIPVWILFCISLAAQETYLSLSATIDTALEDSDRAIRLLSPSVRPVDPLVRSLEAEIQTELQAREATLAFRKRREEELIAEIRYLYFRAKDDPECRKRLLRLNDLPEDLPVHAEDSVEESLQPLLWNSGKRLLQLARRNRPDQRLADGAPLRYAFEIQFYFVNAQFDGLDRESPERIPILIELANLCAWPREKRILPFVPSPVPRTDAPVYVPGEPPPLFDIFPTAFRIREVWTGY